MSTGLTTFQRLVVTDTIDKMSLPDSTKGGLKALMNTEADRASASSHLVDFLEAVELQHASWHSAFNGKHLCTTLAVIQKHRVLSIGCKRRSPRNFAALVAKEDEARCRALGVDEIDDFYQKITNDLFVKSLERCRQRLCRGRAKAQGKSTEEEDLAQEIAALKRDRDEQKAETASLLNRVELLERDLCRVESHLKLPSLSAPSRRLSNDAITFHVWREGAKDLAIEDEWFSSDDSSGDEYEHDEDGDLLLGPNGEFITDAELAREEDEFMYERVRKISRSM